jgi:hypothetical protein
MTELTFTGLDGQNPLGFLAALGLLRIVDDHAVEKSLPRPRLWFVNEGTYVPRLRSELDSEGLCDSILKDARGDAGRLALALAYDEHGNGVEPDAKGATQDLKPSPTLARAYLDQIVSADRRSADLAAAFLSELVQDNNGNSKPTALHFTAGQQKFLDMVGILRKSLTRDQLDEALRGPWRGIDPLPSLNWDATSSRLYALRATNPAKEKRGSVPAANWLAVVGLTYFPVNAQRGRLVTTAVAGGWKDAAFSWPVWSAPTTRPVAESLLRGESSGLDARERAALGITEVFECSILRSDQGGYGSFTPASVVPPRSFARRPDRLKTVQRRPPGPPSTEGRREG